MYYMSKRTEKFKEENQFGNILTISFESFVLDPYEDLEKIKALFNSDFKISESKVLKLQNVPRMKIADGISNAIYERCGWEPGEEGLSEEGELNKRRDFVINQGASDKSLSKLDELSLNYNKQYEF